MSPELLVVLFMAATALVVGVIIYASDKLDYFIRRTRRHWSTAGLDVVILYCTTATILYTLYLSCVLFVTAFHYLFYR